MWKFFTLKKIAIVLVMLAGIVLAARVYALPWVVRQRVEAGRGELGMSRSKPFVGIRCAHWDGRIGSARG